MLEMLASLSAERTVTVAHQSIRILRHMVAVEPSRREALVRDVQQLLKEEDAETALRVVREIERREAAPLGELDAAVIDRYAALLADMAERRTWKQFDVNPERGRALLERLRRAS